MSIGWFQALVGSKVAGDTFIISGSNLDVLNRFIDVYFDPDVYHSSGGALLASDLQIIFTQNGGIATACSISSITNTSGGALAGGESTVRVNLSITGNPSGVETIEIKPSASGVYKDSFGNFCDANDTTGAITLELELDPMYKAGILLQLTGSYSVPNRAQRLIDNSLFAGLRTDGDLSIFDAIHIATFTQEFLKINFVTATKTASIVGSPVQTLYVGQVGAAGGYVDFGISFASATNFTQNSAHILAVIGNSGTNANRVIGARGDGGASVNVGHTALTPRNASNQGAGVVNFNNSGNSTLGTVTDATGVHIVDRNASSGAGAIRQYLNAVEVGSGASSTSSSRSSVNVYGHTENQNGTAASVNGGHEVMAWAWGASIRSVISDISTRFNTWRTDTRNLIPSIVADKLYRWCGQSNMDRAELLTALDASQTTLYNQGAYLMSNTNYNSGSGFEANCYVWWGGEWAAMEPGVNCVDKPGGYFSPVFAFARAEAAKYPGEDLYFIIMAVGGTNMNSWLPGGVPSTMYAQYDVRYDDGIAALTSVTTYMPFYWGQGESDATSLTESGQYEADEQTMLTTEFARNSNTNAIVMQIHGSLPLSTFPYRETVRTAKSNNNTAGEYGASGVLVSIDDLARQVSDPAHLTNTSSITFAQRMSAAYP